MYFYTLTYLTFPTSPPSKVNISSISLKKSFLFFSPLKISLNILPSFKNKIRSQKDALNGSCVTIKIVACIFLLMSAIVSSNNLEAFESKAPVGSSVNCTPIPLCLENRGFNCMHTCVLCTLSFYDKSKQVFFSRISHLLLYS